MRKSLGFKILVPFCVFAIVCGICSTMIYMQISQMNQVANVVSDNYMTVTENCGDIKSDFILIQYNFMRLSTTKTPAKYSSSAFSLKMPSLWNLFKILSMPSRVRTLVLKA